MTITTEPEPSESADSPHAPVEIVELAGPTTERSPVYVLTLVLALAVVAITIFFVKFDESALLGFENDLLAFLYKAPNALERFLLGSSQFVALVFPIFLVGAFVATRRSFGLLVAAVAAGAGALAIWGLQEVLGRADIEKLTHPRGTWIFGSHFPNYAYLGAAAALATVVGAYFGRRWGRVAWFFVGIVVFFRVLSGAELPVDLAMAIATGWALGSGALLVLGSPIHRATGQDLAVALAQSGFTVQHLAPASVDARGSTPWFATTDDGRLFVKALGRDERDADLLFRLFRYLRLRNVGDQRPFSSLRRAVEHEALLALKARDVGVRTPHLLTVATVEPDGLLLAYEMIDGKSCDSVPAEQWTDELLHGMWQQVQLLRRERIAHRDLRRANVFVDPNGTPWIIDFGFSELAATDLMLDQDVAQFLAATAIVVGADRAVAAAVAVLGTEPVARSLAYLQMPAFAGATREALHQQKGLLDAVRARVTARTGAEEVKYEPVNRVTARTGLMLVCSLIALYVLIPQFANVSGMFRQLGDANWGFVIATLFFSFLTYVGASTSLVAACPVPVKAVESLEVSLSGSFVNRITPAGIGGIGLNLRFMQKAGANTTEAASRWGVNALIGGIVHFTLTALFLVWAGKNNAFDFRLPEMPLIVGLAVVLVLAGVVFLIPWGRRKLLGPVTRVVKHAWDGVRSLAQEPARLVWMFVGGSIVTLSYLCGLYVAVRAFGGTTSIAAVGAVYLAGSVVGQAAPTPGGLGAVEAILIAGLTATGLDKDIAVPAVLLFRLATYWIPILPGWATFTNLSHREAI